MNILLHYILKTIYTITARIFYSKISVLNVEKVPVNQPLLIAINHSNAFWDGVMIGLHTKQAVWFLARGDVFKKPVAAKILNAIGIAPIYRMQEGIENIEKNKEVFNRCYQILAKNQSIAIFPEGNCERESKLRPLKKGTARIAHGALESFKVNQVLYITCAGLNYDDPDNLNSEVLINFNSPIKVNEYFDGQQTLDSKLALKLTRDIEQAMDAVMYNVHEHDYHVLFHFIKRNFKDLLVGPYQTEQSVFEQIKQFSNKLNTHDVSNLKGAVLPYYDLLKTYQVREKYVLKYVVKNKFVADYLIFLLLLIPSLPGLLLNSWPYFLAFNTAKKTVKKPEFFSSVNIGIAGLAYFVWYIVIFILGTILLSMLKAALLIVALHFSGIIALHLASYYRSIRAHIRLSKLSKAIKENMVQSRAICSEAIQKFVQL
jgi:1-acyl-sn-glycerol-3-phosphate acyltransferase